MDPALADLVDPDSCGALDALAPRLPASAAVVVESRSSSFAATVAVAWARTLAPPSDQRQFAPAADRWRLAELDGVVQAAALRPEQRNVVVVAAADTLGDAGCARLLRTVEEPGAPTVFVLALSDRSQLSAPMAGRVHSFVTVAGHDAARARTAARDLGATADQAGRLVDLVAPRFELVGVLGAGSLDTAELLDHLGTFFALGPDDGAAPVPAAMAALTSVTASVPTAARSELGRDLCRLQLDRMADVARTRLAARDADGLELVAAVAGAHSLLDRYTPPASALTSVLVRPRAGSRTLPAT